MSHKTVEINGTEYTFTDDPSLGTVKQVQQMQIELMRDVLSEDMLEGADEDVEEEEIMSSILDEGGFEKMQEMMWSRGILVPAQTISLATDQAWSFEEIEGLRSREFIELRNTAEEILGGDAEDFFEELGIATSLMENEANQEA